MDSFSFILLELTLIIALAAMGRGLAHRYDQVSVVGELLIGVVVGNLGYWLGLPVSSLVMHSNGVKRLFDEVWSTGVSVSEAAKHLFPQTNPGIEGVAEELTQLLTGPHAADLVLMGVALWLFANLGMILLLFMVGLETTVGEMRKVGVPAIMVASVGVVVPFLLGFAAAIWLLPDAPTPVHLFVAATLCATSVGITARILKDLNKLQSSEARVILGAAVIDDILGLIVLAVVIGIVTTGKINALEVCRILVLTIVFFGLVIFYGEKIVGWCINKLNKLFYHHHSKLLYPLTLAFMMAVLANLIGLATIVGAFAAGLIILEEHFKRDIDEKYTIHELISPLQTLFAPIFFLLMGMQVDLASFLELETLELALAFTVIAIFGKLVAGLAAGRETDHLAVGIGMVPRGEVGLIFASVGKGLGVLSSAVFSAIIIMVVVTTLVTPLALKWSLLRKPLLRN